MKKFAYRPEIRVHVSDHEVRDMVSTNVIPRPQVSFNLLTSRRMTETLKTPTSHSKILMSGDGDGEHATPRSAPLYVSQPLSIRVFSELGAERNRMLIVNSGFCHYRNSLDRSACPFEASIVYISLHVPKAARKVTRNHGAIVVETLDNLKKEAAQLSEEKALQDTSVEDTVSKGTHRVRCSRPPACIEEAGKNLSESAKAEMEAARKDVWLTLLWFCQQTAGQEWALCACGYKAVESF
jgi:hypothetical protein